MSVKRKLWDRTPDGKAIFRYTITNESGASVSLCSVGAAVVSISVPDKDGVLSDVVVGYGTAENYLKDTACMGKCPGRYANRIGNAQFTLNGKTYKLPANKGVHHLHGGPEGFQKQIWESHKSKGGVEFTYISKDGEQGYPGNMKTMVRYDWTESNELIITISARADRDTVLNLTNHTYFNLNGKGSILRHTLKLNASGYLPTTEDIIPLGPIDPVAGTPMDFTREKTLGRDIKKDFPALRIGKGYDSCWIINGYTPGQLQDIAELYSKKSGILLKVVSTQPAVQIYTGNWLSGGPKGRRGIIIRDYDGVAIECQHFPDSPNHPDYPSTVLKAGKTFREAIIFAFSVK